MNLPQFPPQILKLPDKELGLHLWAWWVLHNAERRRVSQGSLTPEIIESIRVATLGIDSDDVKYAALEKTLRRIAQGDLTSGGRMFRDLMHRDALQLAALDEAKTGRRKQRAIAKKPRRHSLAEQVRQTGARSYAELCKRAPALKTRCSKEQLMQAISRAKSRSK